jgi:replicative DNA helicase
MKELFVIILNGMLNNEQCIEYWEKRLYPDDLKDIPALDMICKKVFEFFKKNNKVPTATFLLRNISANYHSLITEASGMTYDQKMFKDAVNEITEMFQKNTLIRLCKWLEGNKEQPLDKLVSVIETTIGEFNTSDDAIISVEQSATSLLNRMNNPDQSDYLLTGDSYFDMYVALKRCQFVLGAADRKIGKSRYWTKKMVQLIENNNDIRIQWHSLEMTDQDNIYAMLAIFCNIPEMRIRRQYNTLQAYDKSLISDAIDKVKGLPIEFIANRSETVIDVRKAFKRFARKKPDANNILLLDNIGCLGNTVGNDPTSNETDIAVKLMQTRDETQGTVIALHHLSKDVSNKFNKDNGYEPTVNNIRGSARLPDFANIILLHYRPATYKDIIKQAEIIGGKGFAQKLGAYFKISILNRSASIDDKSEIHYKHDMDRCLFLELNI